MMNIFRNLIIKEWFKFFFASLVVLILLITVANLISGFLRNNVTPLEVIFNHLLELPAFLRLIIPVSCLIGSLFSINKLKNRNELTAIFASGYSRKKFILDIISAALLVSMMQLLISSYLEPFAKSHRNTLIKDGHVKFRNLKSKGLKTSTIGSGKIWFKSNDYFFSFSSFNKSTNTINGINAYFFDPTHRLKSVITANSATFNGLGWELNSSEVVNNLNNNLFPGTHNYNKKILNINEIPDDFKQIESDITTLNVLKLGMYIKKLSKSGININEYLVIFLEKFSTPIICILFSLVASTSVFTPNRRNSSFGKNLAIVFTFTLFYWLINSYFLEMGKHSKLNPFFSVFAVPIFFGIFLVIFFLRHRKLR